MTNPIWERNSFQQRLFFPHYQQLWKTIVQKVLLLRYGYRVGASFVSRSVGAKYD